MRLRSPLQTLVAMVSAESLCECWDLCSTCSMSLSYHVLDTSHPALHLSLPIAQKHRLSFCNSLPPVFCSLHTMPSSNSIHTWAFMCNLYFYTSDSTPVYLQDTFSMSCLVFLLFLLEHPFILAKIAKSNSISLHSECFSLTPPTTFSSIRLASQEKRRITYWIPPSLLFLCILVTPNTFSFSLSNQQVQCSSFLTFTSITVAYSPARVCLYTPYQMLSIPRLLELMNISSYYLYKPCNSTSTPWIGDLLELLAQGNLLQELT